MVYNVVLFSKSYDFPSSYSLVSLPETSVYPTNVYPLATFVVGKFTFIFVSLLYTLPLILYVSVPSLNVTSFVSITFNVIVIAFLYIAYNVTPGLFAGSVIVNVVIILSVEFDFFDHPMKVYPCFFATYPLKSIDVISLV